MKKTEILYRIKVLWLLVFTMSSVQVFSSEESIEAWLLRNQEQKQAISTLIYEAEYQCELYKSVDESSYEKLPQPLKEKFAREIVDGDTFSSGRLKIKCTAEGLYFCELNEMKTWENTKHEQILSTRFLVNDAYSMFWRENDRLITRIDHASIDNLDPEETLLSSLYGAGCGYLSEYDLPLGPSLLDKYRQRGKETWSAENIDDRIAVTVYKDGQLFSKRILNPQKRCQLEHYLYYKNGEVYEDSRVVLQKIDASGKDFWLPQEIQTRIYKPTHSGSSLLYKNKTVNLKNIRINTEISEDVFKQESIGFPEGTYMVRRGMDGKETTYVLKDGDFIESDIAEILERNEQITEPNQL